MNELSIRCVQNGFILDDFIPIKHETITGHEYVFETFDSLVKFLDEHLNKPKRTKNER